MRIALVDSGIGMLSTAAALRAARADADLYLSMDPDHMPWGPRPPVEVIDRALAGARAAWEHAEGVDAVVVPCNTASVHGLARLREAFEPEVPVIGTVPAIKPAAASGGPIAVWSTTATTRSGYQRTLIETFADGVEVSPVACAGLAEAVESADLRAIDGAIAHAADLTPPGVRAVVLGCTHYDLVAERISTVLGEEAVLHTAARAVAAQTLRRVGDVPVSERLGRTTVLASGRLAHLPAAALAYPPGRFLAGVSTAPADTPSA